MKKIILGTVAVVLLVLIAVIILNLTLGKKEELKEQIPKKIVKQIEKEVVAVVDAVSTITQGKEDREVLQLRKILGKNDWVISLSPLLLNTGEVQRDVLTFSGEMVSSEYLSGLGYSVANYEVSIGDEEQIIWEATHTNEKADLALWKVEVRGQSMRGVLSIQPKIGEIEDFFFTSIQKEE